MDLSRELRGLLQQIPEGRVTTFKALAEALGDSRAARGVYEVLAEERPPGWHRVVRASGGLPFPEARHPLEAEGVDLVEDTVADLSEQHFDSFASERPLARLRAEQEGLVGEVVLSDAFPRLERIAGIDVSYQGQQAYGAAVVIAPDTLEPLETVRNQLRVRFPYISTYLAYREFDPIVACYRRLSEPPSLLLVDGNGTLHPAGFGVACLVGVRLDQPTVGVAKRQLLGAAPPVLPPGESAPIPLEGPALGHVLQPPTGKPIFISPGHRVSPQTAVRLVRDLCVTRIPEPLRLAHLEATGFRRASQG